MVEPVIATAYAVLVPWAVTVSLTAGLAADAGAVGVTGRGVAADFTWPADAGADEGTDG